MTHPAVQVFDLRAEPCRLERHEWQPRLRRDPAEIVGVVLHSWGTKVGTAGANRLRHGGEARALAHRALEVPYGISCGVAERTGVPVVTIAHPIERYTNASDAGNRHWISIGVMGLFPFEAVGHNPVRHTAMTDGLRAAIEVALSTAAIILVEARSLAGHDPYPPAPLAIVAHRQCANGQRDHFACPGEAVIEAVVGCDLVRDGLFVPDPDRVLLPKYGRPWPDAWRRHLRTDYVQKTHHLGSVAVPHSDERGRVDDDVDAVGEPIKTNVV